MGAIEMQVIAFIFWLTRNDYVTIKENEIVIRNMARGRERSIISCIGPVFQFPNRILRRLLQIVFGVCVMANNNDEVFRSK